MSKPHQSRARIRRIAAVVVSIQVAGACVRTAQSKTPATTGALQPAGPFVDSLRLAQSIPGMAATVSQDGRAIWSEGSGLADRERSVPATAETRFRVGSVSKLFTAAALLRLADAGVLDLDAPLSRYLEPYPVHWPEVTLRQLAGHTAGVRHYRGREFFSTTDYPSLREAIGIITSDMLVSAPGTRYSYSSYGYNLIGAVMAFLLVYPREQLVVAMASNAFTNWSTPEALRLASFFLR